MSPKPRSPGNRRLPKRWALKHGAYYYLVPPGQEAQWGGKRWYRLGKTEAEAYRAWSERLQDHDTITTIGALLDRYSQEIIPTKAPKSQESNRTAVRRLRPVFAAMPVGDIKPRHIYQYRDIVTRKHGPSSANRDIEVISHALSVAVEWGIIDRNPIKGQVRKNRIPRRERYIEDWELAEASKAAGPMLRAYITLKVLTGLRRGDLLRLKLSDLQPDGIHVQPHKTAKSTGQRLIIEWTPSLTAAVDAAKDARTKITGLTLFSTRLGQPYVREDGSANAFDSLWQRFMVRALRDTGLVERFQEKDLRKKVASDLPLEHARALLGHASAETTKRHYRIRGERVKPAR